MKHSIEEIEKMLEGITPGEWVIVEGDEWTSDIATNTPKQGIWTVATVNTLRDKHREDKQFISAARPIIEDLLAEVSRLESLAASRLADQESIEKHTARVCAEICDKIADGYAGHASWAANEIRKRYGVES